MADKKTAKELMNSIVIAMLVVILVVVAGLVVSSITSNSIFTDVTAGGTVTNETGAYLNSSGYTLDDASTSGFTSPVITALFNATDDSVIAVGNASVTGAGVMTNASAVVYNDVLVSYTYTYSTDRNLAGLNVSAVASSFGSFVTNLIAFLAIIGTILGVVWLIFYVKSLFDKRTGIQAMTA